MEAKMPATDDESDFCHERYSPQHPLPEEIRSMRRDSTVCKYCGVSYLIHNEIKNLELRLRTLQAENAELKLKICEHEDRSSKWDAMENMVKSSKIELERRDKILANTKHDMCEMQSKTALLETELSESKENFECLETKYNNLKTRQVQNNKKIASLSENAHLLKSFSVDVRQRTIAFAASSLSDIEKLIKESFNKVNIHFQGVITGLNRKTEVLQSDLTTATKSKDSLSHQLSIERDKAIRFNCHNQTLDAKIKDLSKEISDFQRANNSLKLDCTQFQQQLKQKTTELSSLSNDMNKIKDDNKNTINSFKDTINSQTIEIEKLKKNNKELEKKCNEIEAAKSEAISTKDEMKILKETINEYKTQIEKLTSESEVMTEAHQTQILDLKSNLKSRILDMESWNKQMEDKLEDERNKHRLEIISVKNEVETQYKKEITQLQDEIIEISSKLKEDLKAKESEFRAKEDNLKSDFNRDKEALKATLNNLKKSSSDVERSMKDEICTLNSTIEELKSQNDSFKIFNERATSVESNSMREELECLKTKLKEAGDQMASFDRENNLLKQTVQSECEERIRLVGELANAQKRLYNRGKRQNEVEILSASSKASSSPAPSVSPLSLHDAADGCLDESRNEQGSKKAQSRVTQQQSRSHVPQYQSLPDVTQSQSLPVTYQQSQPVPASTFGFTVQSSKSSKTKSNQTKSCGHRQKFKPT